MQSYGVGEVERMLQLSRGTIRGFISRGFVHPTRGPRREYRFSFQDLVILRAARALVRAKVPPRRIGRSLNALRRQLPESVPLTGLTICAEGNDVVVRKGNSRWQPDTGQYLLELDVSVTDDSLRITEIKRHTDAAGDEHTEVSVETWFERGLEAEEHDIDQALKAYEKVRKLDAQHLEARINLGRLHHEAGRFEAAHEVYREAMRSCEPDATLFYNFGVLLEDSSRYDEAIEAYQQAIAADPDFADAHYNLARLYEVVGKPQHALRHLGEYRRLLKS